MAKKYVYFFGGGGADGQAEMKNTLGGKGANLAEMSRMGIPVPPGFTISTEGCTYYMKTGGKFPQGIKGEVERALKKVETLMGRTYGDPSNPLLFSVRSGARISMPGMMETVLNLGLNEASLPALIERTGNERFVYDAYRRLIMMFSDVVLEKASGIEPKDGIGIRERLEHEMQMMKTSKGYFSDTELDAGDLKKLCALFKRKVKEVLKKEFPDDAREQMWMAIGAVFQSWMGKRAVAYRKIEKIPDDWGTAVNVQVMVFGNMGEQSATGVAFTRNPATGDNHFYGEFLMNAQGEDVVAGTRTPQAINTHSMNEASKHLTTLQQQMPKMYKQLEGVRKTLEKHYRDMQDLEFTVEEGTLYILQTRVGKRNGVAAIRMAVDMCRERLISREEALLRVQPHQLDELLHPLIDPKAERRTPVLATGLPAGPGGATGQIVFSPETAEAWAHQGRKVVLVRMETSAEDVAGMHAAEAILTATGGMTSHAALVARGWGKCCIVGCGALNIHPAQKRMTIGSRVFHEGDFVTLNGTKGTVYAGELPLISVDPDRNRAYKDLMKWADSARRLKVRTNADRPDDAIWARKLGAEGIGLCRTEHMFFGPGRITAVREMILADSEEGRKAALKKLLPFQRKDFVGLFKAMAGLPVTIRTLDPPLHEFLPQDAAAQKELAMDLSIPLKRVKEKIGALHEANPMMGHRGCRLGVTYPEVTAMQAQAIMEAACHLTKRGVKVHPEIMIPLVGTKGELENQRHIVVEAAEAVIKRTGIKVKYTVGTMIEIPRATLIADRIAEVAEFFSFGTNDLTQMTFGYSRDDVGKFLPDYVAKGILSDDPFQTLDQTGVGQLMEIGIRRGRSTRPNLKVGICGEHGGDPASVAFCHRAGLNYVSCSPFRVPIARLAAAHAALNDTKAGK